MTHAILIQNKVAAQTLDSLNRSALAPADLDNGWLVSLPTQNTAATRGLEEVWDGTQPATGTINAMWMVYEPEVVVTVSGTKKYKGIDVDPQDFYTPSGEVCSVYKPQIGDIITLTGDALASGTGAASAYAVAANGAYKLTWASSPVSGLTYQYLATTYVSLGDGSIGTQRVTAYKFVCTSVA
jgi:hypothetical protein